MSDAGDMKIHANPVSKMKDAESKYNVNLKTWTPDINSPFKPLLFTLEADKSGDTLKRPEFAEMFWPGKIAKGDKVIRPFYQNPKACSAVRTLKMALVAASGVGALYLCSKYVLVSDGEIGIATNNGCPEILGPGHHCLLNPFNGDVEVVELRSEYINRLTLHIITIKPTEYGFGWYQGNPVVLGPGIHVINDPWFEWVEKKRQNIRYYSHGTFHWVIVQNGEYTLCWEGETPLVLRQGHYFINSPFFECGPSFPIDAPNNHIGPYNIITVDDGFVGVAFDQGRLECLRPGEHWLNANLNQRFLDFLPTTQQVKALEPLDILTNDGLMVCIKGSVTFRIVHPEKAITNIGSEGIGVWTRAGGKDAKTEKLKAAIISTIMHRCNDTLASLLTGSEILTSAGIGVSGAALTKQMDETPDSLGLEHKQNKQERDSEHRELNQIISYRFKDRLAKQLLDQWGVDLGEMNVIDIEILDQEVEQALAEGLNVAIMASTNRRTAESKAETARILAKGKTDAKKIRVDGQTYKIRELASAQKAAGDELEACPVAVDFRLAETAAKAINQSKASIVICKNENTQGLLNMIGAAAKLGSSSSDGKRK